MQQRLPFLSCASSFHKKLKQRFCTSCWFWLSFTLSVCPKLQDCHWGNLHCLLYLQRPNYLLREEEETLRAKQHSFRDSLAKKHIGEKQVFAFCFVMPSSSHPQVCFHSDKIQKIKRRIFFFTTSHFLLFSTQLSCLQMR